MLTLISRQVICSLLVHSPRGYYWIYFCPAPSRALLRSTWQLRPRRSAGLRFGYSWLQALLVKRSESRFFLPRSLPANPPARAV